MQDRVPLSRSRWPPDKRFWTTLRFSIAAGQHVAIVGSSGAGKSSIAGLLLGWLRASSGEIYVDDQPLDVEALRGSTAWVDPAVQIWNDSLYSNLALWLP